MWDYSSCPEAQLKTWLARHLIAEANPQCSMWDRSAASNAVPGPDGWSEGDRAAAAAAGLQPLGPYSCSLADAGGDDCYFMCYFGFECVEDCVK
jgi:hypothetical protein